MLAGVGTEQLLSLTARKGPRDVGESISRESWLHNSPPPTEYARVSKRMVTGANPKEATRSAAMPSETGDSIREIRRTLGVLKATRARLR
jgi:hypothetical protein